MKIGTFQRNLVDYLSHVSEAQELPVWAELEPGSVIYTLKSVWEKKQKDLNSKEIRKFMVKELSFALNRKIHESQYRLLFGDEEKQLPAKMVMPKDIAKSYLCILFENWPSSETGANDNDGFEDLAFIKEEGQKNEELAIKLCALIYAPGYPVYCRPAPGMGAKGFFHKCGMRGHSIICASQLVSSKIEDDPVIGLVDWMEDIQAFYSNSCSQDALIIWAMREPIASFDDIKTIKALHNIGSIKTAMLTMRTLCLSNALPVLWPDISRRLIVAVYTEERNDLFREEKSKQSRLGMSSNPIPANEIFLPDTTTQWLQEEKQFSATGVDYAISIRDEKNSDTLIEYNACFHRTLQGRSPPIVQKNSPGKKVDLAYTNLHRACREYSKNSEDSKDVVRTAQAHGWLFMTAEEYLTWNML